MAYTSVMDRAISYVRDNYSIDGIDVVSTAETFFVCSVPEKIEDIGGIVENLEERFGCIVDLRRSKAGPGFEFVVNTPESSSNDYQAIGGGATMLANMGRGACRGATRFASQAVGAAIAATMAWYFTSRSAAPGDHMHAP